MALPVFFLLTGTFFAEIGIIGPRWVLLVGAGFLGLCAVALNQFRRFVEAQGRGGYLEALRHVQTSLGGAGRARSRDHVRLVR
jgi:hypothetical protein